MQLLLSDLSPAAAGSGGTRSVKQNPRLARLTWDHTSPLIRACASSGPGRSGGGGVGVVELAHRSGTVHCLSDSRDVGEGW